MKLKAENGAYSSIVGGSVHLYADNGKGHFMGQIPILCNDDRLRDRGVQQRIFDLIANALDGFEIEVEK